MNNTILKFSLESMDFIEEVNDKLFRKARIRAFASGKNAHTLPIDEDVLKRGAATIYNKPILWKYNKYTDDAEGHEKDEVPCGFIPETFDGEKNPIFFERDKDGRLFIVITAYIWNKYSGRLIDIFSRTDNRKDVSIEIVVVRSDDRGIRPKVLDFVIAGITILGEWINPACEGARAELLAFSEDKKKYEKSLFSDVIKIHNSKEDSVDGEWSNPRGKLFNPIVSASNYEELFKEAYLVNGSVDKESPIGDHKYPHHIVKDGALVVHKQGLEAAFRRASQMGIVGGSVKEHLLKHYRELGLSVDNFSEFNITEEQFNEFFSEYLESKEESVGETELNIEKAKNLLCAYFAGFTFSDGENTIEKYSVDEVFEDKVICTDNEFDCKYEIPFSIDENENVMVDMSKMCKMGDENVEAAVQLNDIEKEEKQQIESLSEEVFEEDDKTDDEDHDEGHDEEDDDEAEAVEHDKEESEEDDKVEDKEDDVLFAELKSEIEKLKEENAAYMAQIESMSDYEELKKFKADVEEERRKADELAEMSKVMSDIESRGIEISEDEKTELMSKVVEFSSVDAWANFAKAQVFDRVENISGVLKIGTPFPAKKHKTSSVWDF